MSFYNRVIISGSSPSPLEVWSVGLTYGGSTPAGYIGAQSDLDQWSAAIAARLTALPGANTLLGLLTDQARITKVRTEFRFTNGALSAASETSLNKQGTGTPSKALQVSAVFSLRTALPGRSYRGRVYWPAWSYANDAQMLFPAGSRASWLSDFKALNAGIIADAVSAFPTYDGVLCVRSQIQALETPVTQFEMGSVPDTQRRRRDRAPENYAVLPV